MRPNSISGITIPPRPIGTTLPATICGPNISARARAAPTSSRPTATGNELRELQPLVPSPPRRAAPVGRMVGAPRGTANRFSNTKKNLEEECPPLRQPDVTTFAPVVLRFGFPAFAFVL